MQIQMSREDVENWNNRVRELRTFNRDSRSRIVGILMDTSVGSTGLPEAAAEKKADEILKEFTLFTL